MVKVHKTIYRMAEVLSSGKVYSVVGSNRETKEQIDKDGSLLLRLEDGSKQWHSSSVLKLTL